MDIREKKLTKEEKRKELYKELLDSVKKYISTQQSQKCSEIVEEHAKSMIMYVMEEVDEDLPKYLEESDFQAKELCIKAWSRLKCYNDFICSKEKKQINEVLKTLKGVNILHFTKIQLKEEVECVREFANAERIREDWKKIEEMCEVNEAIYSLEYYILYSILDKYDKDEILNLLEILNKSLEKVYPIPTNTKLKKSKKQIIQVLMNLNNLCEKSNLEKEKIRELLENLRNAVNRIQEKI